MKNYIFKQLLVPFLTVFMILFFVSLQTCKKDTDCNGNILVLNRYDSTPVNNAKVIVTCGKPLDGKCSVRDTGLTSMDGKFVYNKKLEAILDVRVLLDTSTKKPLYNTSNTAQFYGNDLLRLKAGKTVELIIWMDTIVPRGEDL